LNTTKKKVTLTVEFGFSSYSFYQYLRDGRMSILDVIDWISSSEATHMEVATISLSSQISHDSSTLDQDADLVEAIRKRAADRNVRLSNLVVPADLVNDDAEVVAHHMNRLKRHLDVAADLGIEIFRHDVAKWARTDRNVAEFELLLPKMVERCKELAQYAATRGITTTVENHGLLMNGSERIRRLIHLVDEPNFKTTLDVGNFMSVDENPTVAVAKNAPYAAIVHLKDFYERREYPGPGWHHTPGGRYLLGSIVGYGDLDMRGIVRGVVESGFDGPISIEFEGIEDALLGATRSLENAMRLFNEAQVSA